MARKTDKTSPKSTKGPRVNPDLEGFDVRVDSFGEIKTNLSIDKINEFLNRNVEDKKLRDREDLAFNKGKVQGKDQEKDQDKNKNKDKKNFLEGDEVEMQKKQPLQKKQTGTKKEDKQEEDDQDEDEHKF